MTVIDSPSSGLAIEVRDLRKSYGQVEAVRGVSFEVARGEVFCLLGPNGAGKTTVVEILEAYRTRSGGEARVHLRPYGGC
jgi:ABC-2 type transport system ATP-binding protein